MGPALKVCTSSDTFNNRSGTLSLVSTSVLAKSAMPFLVNFSTGSIIPNHHFQHVLPPSVSAPGGMQTFLATDTL